MKIVFLGTGGSFPTPSRNVSSYGVKVGMDTLLLDCGEGTQRQLRASSLRFTVDRIFLTHLHLDHCLGLPGYVWTQALLNRRDPLRVYCPAGTAGVISGMVGDDSQLGFPYELIELRDGDEVQGEGYRVVAARVEHVGQALGYRVQEADRPGRVDMARAQALGIAQGPMVGRLVRGEAVRLGDRLVTPEEVVGPSLPGRSMAYSGDARACEALNSLAAGVDLLIHESTFAAEHQTLARDRGHATSEDAARCALAAGAAQLALTHLSQRYQDEEGEALLLGEAKALFPEVFVARDLMECELSPH